MEEAAPASAWCTGAWLVLSVSASWVGVAQLARAAEQRTELLQHCSVVPLMTWANSTAWVALAVPHMLRSRLSGRRAKAWENGGGGHTGGLLSLLHTDAFTAWQPPKFLAIAFTTNLFYIAALHFLPASLNTAIFCTSPIFTLFFSAAWLPQDVAGDSPSEGRLRILAALRSRRALSVALSVLGVLLIAEPWRATEGGQNAGSNGISFVSRAAGACLSLLAAFGTAVYQVYFKVTFGDSLGPTEVGLFLARMGASSTLILGPLFAGLLATGTYPLHLGLVPWGLVLATAASSALFNFLIKFGLSVDSPVGISLATQIGIPLNLLLDVLVVHEDIDGVQAAGTLAMLVSFTLQQRRRAGGAGSPRASAGELTARLVSSCPEKANGL